MKDKLNYSIDSVGLSRTVGIAGWAFHDAAEIRALHLQSDRFGRIPCRFGLPRPDVADALRGRKRAAHSGFVAGGLKAEGLFSLVAELADGREIAEPLFRIEEGSVSFLTKRTSGVVVREEGRSGPDLSHLSALLRVHRQDPAPVPSLKTPVLVVVPVYEGLRYLRPFFASLFTHSGDCRILIVDDGNQNPEVLSILAEASGDERARLVRRPVNGGFVEAVREGFRNWRGEHLVLANTDTILPEGWLGRLVAPLERDERAASVTPFSNAATICGFPRMPEDNPLFLDLEPGVIDGAFRHLDAEALGFRLPTGVGFCMALSRHALAQIGFFEEKTFGLGYGEENDWSRKAIQAGFHHLLGADLFVYHAHGGSFPSERKRELMRRNQEVIRQRYPDYDSEVAALSLFDPWRPLRGFIAFILASRSHPQGAVVQLLAEGTAHKAPPPDRPSLRIEFSREALIWRYFLSWPGGDLVLDGGNMAELDEFFRRIRIGEFKAGDLSKCRVRPSAERLAEWVR